MNPILHNYIPQNHRDEVLIRMGADVFRDLLCSTQDNLGLVLENLRDISPLEELIIRIWGEFPAADVDEALAEAKKLPQVARKPHVHDGVNNPYYERYCNGVYEDIVRRAAIPAEHANVRCYDNAAAAEKVFEARLAKLPFIERLKRVEEFEAFHSRMKEMKAEFRSYTPEFIDRLKQLASQDNQTQKLNRCGVDQFLQTSYQQSLGGNNNERPSGGAYDAASSTELK